ncbi:zinc finger protein 82 homolog isoform X6 [Macaca nemestrina]|uniref:zinc finger protein 82 homolog isoform X6 n=1 Tax=Macaca nemestrina TaxID=9545 RepID=UPI0039B91C8F
MACEFVTFRDMAIDFSHQEWEYLDLVQKTLYQEVMVKNYGIGSFFCYSSILDALEELLLDPAAARRPEDQRKHSKWSLALLPSLECSVAILAH